IAKGERGDATAVQLDDDARPLTLAFDRNYSLQHAAFDGDDDVKTAPFYWADANGRVHFAQFEVGSGLLTVVSDLDIWQSAHIGEHDHALALAQLTDTASGVSLIGDVEVPGLPTLLWQWARELIIALALVIAAWAWARARRFGPIRDPQPQVRRSLAEHIHASATWLWRRGHAQVLLDAARGDVLRRLHRQFPDLEQNDDDARLTLLQHEAGVGIEPLRRALLEPAPRDAQRF